MGLVSPSKLFSLLLTLLVISSGLDGVAYNGGRVPSKLGLSRGEACLTIDLILRLIAATYAFAFLSAMGQVEGLCDGPGSLVSVTQSLKGIRRITEKVVNSKGIIHTVRCIFAKNGYVSKMIISLSITVLDLCSSNRGLFNFFYLPLKCFLLINTK